MDDNASYCPKCGAPCAYGAQSAPVVPGVPVKKASTTQTIAEVFMIIGCIASGAALIPLCWTIPMTVKYFNSVKEGKDVSTGFKVCSLIFVNLIAGILMLVGDDLSV